MCETGLEGGHGMALPTHTSASGLVYPQVYNTQCCLRVKSDDQPFSGQKQTSTEAPSRAQFNYLVHSSIVQPALLRRTQSGWVYVGQTLGNTPHISLKLKSSHSSACAASFKA